MVYSQREIRVDTPSDKRNNLWEKQASGSMFGNQNTTEISVARRDFECYTLMGVPSLLSKLAYLDELRGEEGQGYEHWGMERTYGTDQTRRALEEVHLFLSREMLMTRTEDLSKDAKFMRTREEVPEPIRNDFAKGLSAPSHLTAAERAHFELTLETVRTLQLYFQPTA